MLDFLFNKRKNTTSNSRDLTTNNVSTIKTISLKEAIPNIHSVKSNSDILFESPYYERYKELFDLIRIKDNKEPKYKFDWLLESIDSGYELENNGYYILKSIDDNLPYFCETESEYLAFFNRQKPVLKGSVSAIFDLLLQYCFGERKHYNKAKYWKKKITEMAMCGNYEAQAALCTKMGAELFGEDASHHFKLDYEEALWKLANNDDGEAQLAVGEFLTPFPSIERVKWLSYAASKGLTDAWYYLASVTFAWKMFDEDGNQRKEPLEEHEIENLDRKIANAYLQGAEANNGTMAAECQWQIAWRYEDGDDVFPYDLEKAYHWYKMAQSNGADVERNLREISKRLGEKS